MSELFYEDFRDPKTRVVNYRFTCLGEWVLTYWNDRGGHGWQADVDLDSESVKRHSDSMSSNLGFLVDEGFVVPFSVPDSVTKSVKEKHKKPGYLVEVSKLLLGRVQNTAKIRKEEAVP
jgi:hypothetical protein